MGKTVKHFYEFGAFRIDLEERLLMHEGQPVHLAPKVLDTLLLLIERRGRVVRKDEMMNLLWPDSFVEESNLTQNVFTLRKALDEGSDNVQYIETVPRRGYRFVANVKETQEEIHAPEAEVTVPMMSEEEVVQVTATRRADAITSLAVLPMISESNDPNVEFLMDGMTESIINILSRLRRVHVVAPSLVFAFKGQKVDPQKVARALGTDAVLSGSVLVSGDELIIKTELMDTANGWQIWGEQYFRPLADILTLQHEVSTKISEKLLANLSPEEEKRLGKQHTTDPEAYQSYLRGRYYWKKRTAEGYRRAIEEFEQAVKFDPTYALAHSGLADSYIAYNFHGIVPTWETGPKAKAAVTQALAIDDTLAEAHTSLACVKMMYERDWAGAEREFKRAIELDPTYAQAFNWYSHFLMALGRVEESFAQSQIALRLDPLDDSINQYLGWHYIHARQFERAVSQLEKTLQLNPNFFLARVTLGVAHSQRRDFSKAIAEFERAGEVEHPPLLSAFLGHAYAMAGRVQEASRLLAELKELSTRTYVPPYSIALIHTALDEKQEAFEWFDVAYETHNGWLNWIKVAPEFDSLHSDPRFTDMLLRLGLQPD
ncbi:MAG TPA: winged helix-turn-helix domain-containing protein [Pyrinomonadaceae bacterium]|jgi:DNA-binding winged helix-turn-helix (wHTH) protein/Tfp pilus assembly protein PilF|nr:winged helix-turn-helix domain-containing protein [Pyrinomonadaceae bacterium]